MYGSDVTMYGSVVTMYGSDVTMYGSVMYGSVMYGSDVTMCGLRYDYACEIACVVQPTVRTAFKVHAQACKVIINKTGFKRCYAGFETSRRVFGWDPRHLWSQPKHISNPDFERF